MQKGNKNLLPMYIKILRSNNEHFHDDKKFIRQIDISS